ncbi:putative polyketide synthase [Annulohypoxylon bovei var. microspora]|nr:putative polyketide synthase [Annulohypoxylon bovei var. microspora]
MNPVENGKARGDDIAAGLGVDGDICNDVAVCGFSLKFPQDAVSPEGFWRMMLEKRCAMTEFPSNRLDPNGFYREKNRLNTLGLRGGHFIQEDLSAFDADFFSISPAEAASMDPMQRWLLEAAYKALENAGIPMESVSNTATGVYAGSFSADYMFQLIRDPECPPSYASQGIGLSMLANRISWFFNLRGPSVSLDSACSSTATAIDIACQALRNGSCNMAMVAGCTLAGAPEGYIWLNTSNFLSPDSRCFSFDSRANGYSRGEGMAVIILKKAVDAIRDGNTIRAVIRSTGSNEDGKTPGITQPSREAQERLIRATYSKAGLSMAHTRFFEAHGTGTRIGDPREARAIGSAFREHRSDEDPLYVGAVKSNVGHLEGASGLAGVIKTVLVLEKGIIPPNTNFRELNPKIDAKFLRLEFPQESYPWPTLGLRRASVNSFGFGGANTHIVIDDAYNYLKLRSLKAKHCTVSHPPNLAPMGYSKPLATIENNALQAEGIPRLFVWSAADKKALDRVTRSYHGWASDNISDRKFLYDPEAFMANLAFTLDSCRSYLPWRFYAILRSPSELTDLQRLMSVPIQTQSRPLRLGFAFSGQGAQWFAMGRELLCYSSFKEELVRAGNYVQSLGCHWSVIDELCKTEDESNVDQADFGQPLSTILQVAIVNLLRRFEVWPSAVVGHSSGEIAAAYAAGALTCESAWRLAYFRGLLSAELSRSNSGPRGAMMSVGLSENRTRELISALNHNAVAFGITMACVNSPNNVTVSGEEVLIDQLKLQLDEKKEVFSRKLRVPLAYHSPQMEKILAKYVPLVGTLATPCGAESSQAPMISSVTGERIDTSSLTDPLYWADSIVSPVQFSRALLVMCAQSHAGLVKKIDRSHVFTPVVDHIVEIGPHATLQGPIRDTLRISPRETPVGYTSILRRGSSAMETIHGALGELYSHGLNLKLRPANEPNGEVISRSLLVDLPEYPFDHSQKYWHESRLSRNYRLRANAPSELLGVRSRDWNISDARWRHFMRLAEMPWAEQHVINGTILYPGTGMLAMAVEAARQLVSESVDSSIDGYTFRDVHFENAMDLTPGGEMSEVQTSLRPLNSQSKGGPTFEFAIRTHAGSGWHQNCRGFISVDISEPTDTWAKEKLMLQRGKTAKKLGSVFASCKKPVPSPRMYSFLRECGYDYGQSFQAAKNQHCNHEQKQAVADVALYSLSEESHVFHPVSLDAILHLCFTAFSSGGTVPMATSIPSQIRCMWISSKGLHWTSTQESAAACTAITGLTSRGFTCCGGAFDTGSSHELRLWYEGLELTSVSRQPAGIFELDPRQWYMNIDCKVALDTLDNQEVCSYLSNLHPAEQDTEGFFQDLELLVEMSLDHLTKNAHPSFPQSQDLWQRRYWDWAQHHLTNRRRRKDTQSSVQTNPRSFQELISCLASTNKVGKVYARVASDIVEIFDNKVSALELLVHSGLLKDYYQELAGYRCSRQIASYVDLLAHQKPGMRILEVGGGTGAATRSLIGALRCGGAESLRCDRYDFTDISRVFSERAREEFGAFQTQMTFGELDIEKDLAIQGHKEAEYDVVVADNVLHATSDIEWTLRNIRKALKPGGKLLMQEPLRSSGWTLGFVFGLFPGWWLGAEENRLLSPAISSDAWHTALINNGFTGSDIIFKDFDDDLAHQVGWIVSTNTDEKTRPKTNNAGSDSVKRFRASIIINELSEEQQWLSKHILSNLRDVLGIESRVLGIEAAGNIKQKEDNELVIFLADYGNPFLASLDEKSYNWMKLLIKSCRHLLWVSGNGAWHVSPDHGLLDGLARALRAEYYELHLVTLVLDITKMSCDKVSLIMHVAKEMVSRQAHEPYEQEYLEVDGNLQTRRLIEAHDLKTVMDAKLIPYKVVETPLDGKLRLELSTSSYSLGAAPCFIQSGVPEVPYEDDVDIAIRAVSLQSQNHAAALGQNDDSNTTTYYYCLGTVLGSSSGTESTLKPGDRVFAACSGAIRSHIRLSARNAVKVPKHVSFLDACTAAPYLTTVYHALVEVSRVKESDSVLVHNGSTPIGQAALRLLSDRGVGKVWTTAGDKDDSAWISGYTGTREDRILPQTWFESQPMALSQWDPKFDIVLWSDLGSSAPLLMSHVKPGGRYVSIHSGVISKHNSQRIYCAPPSISMTTIHMGETQGGNFGPSSQSLQYAISRCRTLIMNKTKFQASVFRASEVARAFDSVKRSDNNVVVLEFNESDVVEVRIPTKLNYSFSLDASYLVAGGLGGIGRAISRWLVTHGARHLILLSRSGPRTAGAQQLLSELGEKGVRVETPLCDISDRRALNSTLARCAETMPPIRGCIQSSMVVTELIFEKMTFPDWKAAVDPKVQGSWNLHSALPKGLDFFILVSSMMGTIGGVSLSAYSAANSYMDALARYRVSRGERASALGLGIVPDSGYLTEHPDRLAGVEGVEKYAFTRLKDIKALLEIYCDPDNPFSRNLTSCHAVLGVRPPAHWHHLEEVPPIYSQPLWGHMHHVPVLALGDENAEDEDSAVKTRRKRAFDAAARLAAASSLAEAAEIASEALAQRISALLGTAEDRLDPKKSMLSYGVDSLSAIDIRNWVGQIFNVDLPVFEILGGANLTTIGLSIARKAHRKQAS